MMYYNLLISVTLLISSLFTIEAQVLRKEAYLSVSKTIRSYGYTAESHKAITEDGYQLKMQRIPNGKTNLGKNARKPVLLVHGLLGSAHDFIIMGPERSLAYMLADEGYDVWLGNLRGNIYTTHKNMSRDDPNFWNYSFHEHGTYDLPAMIDKVLSITKRDKLLYIGYSMGTTSFFVMASQRPEYNSKVVSFIALAPAVFLDNMKPLANTFIKNMNLPNTLRSNGMNALAFSQRLRDFFVSGLCQARGKNEDLCLRVLYSFVGEDYDETDWDVVPVMFSKVQPCSFGQIEHYGKIAMTSEFTKLNGDMTHVNKYNLTALSVPTVLMYGNNDQLCEKSQTQRLAKILMSSGALLKSHMVKFPKFNHLDFVYAKNVHKHLNKDVIKYVNKLYIEYDKAKL